MTGPSAEERERWRGYHPTTITAMHEALAEAGFSGVLQAALNDLEAAERERDGLRKRQDLSPRQLANLGRENTRLVQQLEAVRIERNEARAEAGRLREALEEWRKELYPFCEDGWIEGLRHLPMEAQLDWYETGGSNSNIFTEARLYKALGKEDARSVLGVWRRFRFVVERIRAALEPRP